MCGKILTIRQNTLDHNVPGEPNLFLKMLVALVAGEGQVDEDEAGVRREYHVDHKVVDRRCLDDVDDYVGLKYTLQSVHKILEWR